MLSYLSNCTVKKGPLSFYTFLYVKVCKLCKVPVCFYSGFINNLKPTNTSLYLESSVYFENINVVFFCLFILVFCLNPFKWQPQLVIETNGFVLKSKKFETVQLAVDGMRKAAVNLFFRQT